MIDFNVILGEGSVMFNIYYSKKEEVGFGSCLL